MNLRTLQENEYARLASVAEGYVPDPSASRVVVAMDQDEIIGRMILCTPIHIEGTWVRPDHRKGTVAYRLHQFCLDVMRELGLTKVLAYADNPATEDYLKRLGYTKMPISLWEKEL